MKVQKSKLAKVISESTMAKLVADRCADDDTYGYIELEPLCGDTMDLTCSRLLKIALEHGIAPAAKLFAVGHGESLCTAYQINAGMIFVATNGEGDVWTKDGYIMLGSDIKLIKRTYERNLPTDYANDKGLYVW